MFSSNTNYILNLCLYRISLIHLIVYFSQNSSAALSITPSGGKIVFNLQRPKTLTCYDTYLILDRENWYFKIFVFRGQHTRTFARTMMFFCICVHELNELCDMIEFL
jgi:hypothetical protein